MNGESPGDDKDKSFVFGAYGNSSGAKATTTPGNAAVTPVSDEEEFSTPVGDFVFGSESTPCSESRRSDGDSGKTGREACPDTCRKPDIAQNGDGEARDDDSEVNLHAEMMKKLNISEGAREYSNAPPAFIFGSSGKGNAECKGAAAASRPCSFSSNGFRQSDSAADNQIPAFHPDTIHVNNLTSTTFGDFKVPLCDPSSLKSSLFPEMGRTPVHVRSKRSSKDQRSNKVKGKKKQHEPNLCKDQASKGNESQEKLSSPGYSSPMDFSPYEGEKSSNQFPTETPLHPSHCSTNARDPSVFTAEDPGSIRMPQFSFSASTSQGETSTKKLHAVKKYRRKVNNLFPKKNLNTTMRNNQENQAKQEPASASVMPGECEVWRLR